MPKTIIRTMKYRSASDPGRLYTALLYDDGTSSCNCPGWTRRVGPGGERTCKHLIAAGLTPVSVSDAAAAEVKLPSGAREKRVVQSKGQFTRATRKFQFDD